MRLTQTEVDQLILAIGEFTQQNPAELRLYGSRVDDQRKGGDIDLLLIVTSPALKASLQTVKHHLLARIKELIGEQKIDLKICLSTELDDAPFLKLIYPKSICLKKWI